MKKIFIFALLFAMIFSTTLSIGAEGLSEQVSITSNIALEKNHQEILFDTKYYDESLSQYDLLQKNIVVTYNFAYWEFFDDPLSEIVKYADTEKMIDYWVLDSSPYRISKLKSNDEISISLKATPTVHPTYLNDVVKALSVSSADKAPKNIICFDGSASHQGIVMYYVYEDATEVVVYEDIWSEALRLPLDKFQAYAKEYYSYITSDEVNYDENGKPLYGVNASFKEFYNSNGNIKDNGETFDSFAMILTICAMSAVAVLIVVALIGIRKSCINN